MNAFLWTIRLTHWTTYLFDGHVICDSLKSLTFDTSWLRINLLMTTPTINQSGAKLNITQQPSYVMFHLLKKIKHKQSGCHYNSASRDHFAAYMAMKRCFMVRISCIGIKELKSNLPYSLFLLSGSEYIVHNDQLPRISPANAPSQISGAELSY